MTQISAISSAASQKAGGRVNLGKVALAFIVAAGATFGGSFTSSVWKNVVLGLGAGAVNNIVAQFDTHGGKGFGINPLQVACDAAEGGLIARSGLVKGQSDAESMVGGQLPQGLAAIGTNLKDPASFC